MKDFKIGDRVRVIDAPCPEWMQNMPARQFPDYIRDIFISALDAEIDKLEKE